MQNDEIHAHMNDKILRFLDVWPEQIMELECDDARPGGLHEDLTEETDISGTGPYPSEARMVPGGIAGEELRQSSVFAALTQVSPTQQPAYQLADAECGGVTSIGGVIEDGLQLQGDPNVSMCDGGMSHLLAMQQPVVQFADAKRVRVVDGAPSISDITETALQTQRTPKRLVDWDPTFRDVPECCRKKPNCFSNAKIKLIGNQFQDPHDKASCNSKVLFVMCQHTESVPCNSQTWTKAFFMRCV